MNKTSKSTKKRKIIRKKTLVKKNEKDKRWKSPIPKKIHLIWIGGEQPDYFKLFLINFYFNRLC